MTVTKEFLLPLHKHYYVGDIGYVLEDEDFNAILINQDPPTGVHTYKGHKFFLLTDGPGDGTFPMDDLTDLDDEDYESGLSGFMVDCGTWGILPLEMLNQEWLEDDLFKFGFVIGMTRDEIDYGEGVDEFDVSVVYSPDGFPLNVDFAGYRVNVQNPLGVIF